MTTTPWRWQDDAHCKTIDLSKVEPIPTFIEVEENEDGTPNEPIIIPEVLRVIGDIFFVEEWEEEKVERAKDFCAVCSVRTDCLDFALGTREREGIWGGTTGNERRSMLNRMRKAGDPIPRYQMPMRRSEDD